MNVLEEARSYLEQAGYRTESARELDGVFYFEDLSLLGFVVVHESVNDMTSHWEELQDKFLKQSASLMRRDPQKAWNVYSIHMTNAEASPDGLQEMERIEEDFRGTRKIATASVRSRADVRQALLPLLPIQNQMSLTSRGDMDRVRERIAPAGGPLTELTGTAPPKEIANSLLEQE